MRAVFYAADRAFSRADLDAHGGKPVEMQTLQNLLPVRYPEARMDYATHNRPALGGKTPLEPRACSDKTLKELHRDPRVKHPKPTKGAFGKPKPKR